MWKELNPYCWTNGEYNIAKVGNAAGYSYEVWRLSTRELLAVNLPDSKTAIAECRKLESNQPEQPELF